MPAAALQARAVADLGAVMETASHEDLLDLVDQELDGTEE